MVAVMTRPVVFGAVVVAGVHRPVVAVAPRPVVAVVTRWVPVAVLSMMTAAVMPVVVVVTTVVLPVFPAAILGQEHHDAHPSLHGRLDEGVRPGVGRGPRRERDGGRKGDEAGQEPWDPGHGEHRNSSGAMKEKSGRRRDSLPRAGEAGMEPPS